MDRSSIEARVRAVYGLMGDPKAYRAAFSPEIVWHVPGNNPVSGEYRGEDYFTLMPSRMAPLDEWRFSLTGVMVNEKSRAAVVHFAVDGLRRGKRIAIEGAHMIRLDESGRIVEGWGFTKDQAALDDFFSA